jgi:hypothetical protein
LSKFSASTRPGSDTGDPEYGVDPEGVGGWTGGDVMTGEPAVLNDQIGPGVVPLLFLATTCQ